MYDVQLIVSSFVFFIYLLGKLHNIILMTSILEFSLSFFYSESTPTYMHHIIK